jgi:hypothetical protein
MFLDTSFNSLSTVFSNIYDSFIETATKMWQYAKCLPVQKQPGARVVISEFHFKIRNFNSPHCNIVFNKEFPCTYDHRLKKTGHPVRSAIHKLEIGGLVVGSVTTSEYPLLYVFDFLSFAPLPSALFLGRSVPHSSARLSVLFLFVLHNTSQQTRFPTVAFEFNKY